ncbi:outer membrane beta-barrel protein [Sphingobacterium gobiense]|nr:outer membrane beta-barrel protein [Sphingobacterium gobiense]
MKKLYILVLVACLLATGRSYSQDSKFNISAHTQLGTTKFSRVGDSSAELKQFTITPRATFRIDKVWAVGALYNYRSTEERTYLSIPGVGGGNIDTKTTDQYAGVLVQTYLFDNGKFAAFLELDGTMGTSKTEILSGVTGTPTKSDLYSSAFHAGGRYTFFKGLGAEIRLNHLASYRKLKGKELDTETSQFDLFNNVLNQVSLGLSYQF